MATIFFTPSIWWWRWRWTVPIVTATHKATTVVTVAIVVVAAAGLLVNNKVQITFCPRQQGTNEEWSRWNCTTFTTDIASCGIFIINFTFARRHRDPFWRSIWTLVILASICPFTCHRFILVTLCYWPSWTGQIVVYLNRVTIFNWTIFIIVMSAVTSSLDDQIATVNSETGGTIVEMNGATFRGWISFFVSWRRVIDRYGSIILGFFRCTRWCSTDVTFVIWIVIVAIGKWSSYTDTWPVKTKSG